MILLSVKFTTVSFIFNIIGSDVTVFMRRGQFNDKPDTKTRRSGDGGDMFATNASLDYEDQRPPAESKPLADTWMKTQDTRKYAEVLTRYKPNRIPPAHEPEPQEISHIREPPAPVREMTTQEPPRAYRINPASNSPVISIPPNPLMPTVSWRSGSSEIVMRNFEPLHDYTAMDKHKSRPDTLYPTRSTKPQSISIFNQKEKAKGYVDGKIRDGDENFVPMRVWGTTARPVIPDEPEDVDEDNIVYKPV